MAVWVADSVAVHVVVRVDDSQPLRMVESFSVCTPPWLVFVLDEPVALSVSCRLAVYDALRHSVVGPPTLSLVL
jgi:hypothetical protein